MIGRDIQNKIFLNDAEEKNFIFIDSTIRIEEAEISFEEFYMLKWQKKCRIN